MASDRRPVLLAAFIMLACGPATAPPALALNVVVTCQSDDSRPALCPVPGLKSAQLREQISYASCAFGKSWGVKGEAIWVDKGCRAHFNVEVE